MSEVFAIRNDGYGFQTLDLSLLDVARHAPDDLNPDDVLKFSQQNASWADWWQVPDTRFIANEDYEKAQVPDISTWQGATLVLSPKASRYLAETLKTCGELLPVKIGDETFHIFNCLTLGQEDREKSAYEYAGDTPIALSLLVFQLSALTNIAFKSKFESCLTVFCIEKLKAAAEQYQLTGVIFDSCLIETY